MYIYRTSDERIFVFYFTKFILKCNDMCIYRKTCNQFNRLKLLYNIVVAERSDAVHIVIWIKA